MQQVKKIVIGILVYVLILASLPSGAWTGVAEASTSLKKLSLNTGYYVSGASQYQNKTFILGSKLNDWEKGDSLAVLNGTQVSTIIPSTQLGYDFGYDSLFVNTPNKLYLSPNYLGESYSLMNGFVVDKNTNKYEKKTLPQLFSPFFSYVEKNGYTVSTIESAAVVKDDITWLQMSVKDSKANSYQRPIVIVNKNGIGKIFGEETNSVTSKVDTYGNLFVSYYYYDQQYNEYQKFIKLDSTGKETVLTLPNTLQGSFFFIDSNNYLYFKSFDYDKDVYTLNIMKVNGTTLEPVKSISSPSQILLDNNNRVWYADTNENFGYLEKSLAYTPMFTFDSAHSLYGSRINSISSYGNNIFVSSYRGYGKLPNITTPQAPRGMVITDHDKVVKGIADPGTKIIVKAGTKTYTATAKADGTFAVTIALQKAGTVLYVSAVNGYALSSSVVKVIVKDKTAPATPKLKTISNRDSYLSGTTERGAAVVVKVGTKTYKTTAKSNGTFSIKVGVQKAGTSLVVTVTDASGNATYKKVTVADKIAPSAPKVNKVKSRDTVVKGTAEAGATIRVKIGSKTYKGTVKSNKTFTVKISKQKSGKKLTVTATDKAGNVSKSTTVVVKK